VLTSARLSWLFGGVEGLQKFTTDLEKLNPFPAHRYLPFGSGTQSFGEYDLFMIVIGWSLIVIVSLVVYLLVRSPWGRALKSIREDEDAARSLGKNVFAYKLQSLALGGVIGAFGGVIIAVGGRSASPNDYSTAFTFFAWTVMILGGVGTVIGPILAEESRLSHHHVVDDVRGIVIVQPRADVEIVGVIQDSHLGRVGGRRTEHGLELDEVADRLRADPHRLVQHSVDQRPAR
jgi:hypothetical protein